MSLFKPPKFSLFLFICLTYCGTLAAQSARDVIKADVNKAGGVYSMYSFDTPPTAPAPAGYEAVYISHYGRHGARFIIEDSEYDYVASVLTKAHKSKVLTSKGEDAYKRFMSIYPYLKNRAGDLSPKGYEQHKELGRRMYRNYPSIFKHNPYIVAFATVYPRCIMSMAAFSEGMKELDPKLRFFKEVSRANMPFLNPHSSYNPKGVPKDQDFKSPKAPWRAEHRAYCNSIVSSDSLMNRLFTDAKAASAFCDPNRFEQDLFSVASHMQCTDYSISFFDFFTQEEIFRLWECDNYKYYVEKGPDPRNKGRMSSFAEAMLENIIDCADKDMAAGSPNVRLRFGHDGCIMALLTMMNIEGWNVPVTDPAKIKDVWQTYNIPMAANVQFIFYKSKKDKDILVRAMLNERDMRMPLPGTLAPYYRWEDFKIYYKDIIKKAQLTLEATR